MTSDEETCICFYLYVCRNNDGEIGLSDEQGSTGNKMHQVNSLIIYSALIIKGNYLYILFDIRVHQRVQGLLREAPVVRMYH